MPPFGDRTSGGLARFTPILSTSCEFGGFLAVFLAITSGPALLQSQYFCFGEVPVAGSVLNMLASSHFLRNQWSSILGTMGISAMLHMAGVIWSTHH